jgi:hypothetical protein
LRKKLFLPVTGPSPRLRKHHHALRHENLPYRIDSPADPQRSATAPESWSTIRNCRGSVNECVGAAPTSPNSTS